jgi:hypothetical protein
MTKMNKIYKLTIIFFGLCLLHTITVVGFLCRLVLEIFRGICTDIQDVYEEYKGYWKSDTARCNDLRYYVRYYVKNGKKK